MGRLMLQHAVRDLPLSQNIVGIRFVILHHNLGTVFNLNTAIAFCSFGFSVFCECHYQIVKKSHFDRGGLHQYVHPFSLATILGTVWKNMAIVFFQDGIDWWYSIQRIARANSAQLPSSDKVSQSCHLLKPLDHIIEQIISGFKVTFLPLLKVDRLF